MEAAIAEIKPNIKKAFILNIMIIGVAVILIIAMLIFLNSVVGLDVFLDSFKELGINISTAVLLSYSIFSILFITGLLLILNYVTLGKIRYTLYQDKITYSKSLFIMQISDKTIPYANIAKITYKNKPFLNTAKIILELTGMKESKIELDFIDDAEEVVGKIQELIKDYRANYYAQYSQNYRFQNIIDRY